MRVNINLGSELNPKNPRYYAIRGKLWLYIDHHGASVFRVDVEADFIQPQERNEGVYCAHTCTIIRSFDTKWFGLATTRGGLQLAFWTSSPWSYQMEILLSGIVIKKAVRRTASRIPYNQHIAPYH